MVSECALQGDSNKIASGATVRPLCPPHNGPKLLILAPQDIPDISGYQLGFGCQCVKAYNNVNHVINQKILQIRFVSNLDICKIVIVCPGQHHVKAQVWSFENVREKQK